MEKMKIILSRKGTDSKYGGIPSLIINDKMVPLPIPDKENIKTGAVWNTIYWDSDVKNIADYFINKQSQYQTNKLHLDPDVRHEALERPYKEWRGIFGQCEAAQGHLDNQEICIGDLFLFFGWFDEVIQDNKNWKFKKEDKHAIWGWLQIDEIIKVGLDSHKEKEWMRYHPHFQNDFKKNNNTIYIAKKYLDLGIPELARKPGYGVFNNISNERILTREGETRSKWHLPDWMLSEEINGNGKVNITYHKNRVAKRNGNKIEINSAAIGQEFVLKFNDYKNKEKEYKKWLVDIFSGVKDYPVETA